ncbi:MFS-type transporter clz9-like [Leptopilina heterotoma]|uniref:MFS-type transporter clz9-like n=1 Tax=Leptopilina heterotoma TaxID=63436 RepID=UPI001CA8CAF9|nr:MFS-type transporter clz9-like [Leptopilina heterotoma]
MLSKISQSCKSSAKHFTAKNAAINSNELINTVFYFFLRPNTTSSFAVTKGSPSRFRSIGKNLFLTLKASDWIGRIRNIILPPLMVRNYKGKSRRGDWSEESMKNAVDSVVEGKMGFCLAAKTFAVPQTTLERKVKAVLFSVDEENELCSHLLDMEKSLYGLTSKDLRGLVYQLAVCNNKSHPFNDENKRSWERLGASVFKKTPRAFYKTTRKHLGCTCCRIQQAGAQKGRKQVGAITSAERGATITVEICLSASGQYMPPMIIFPRKRMNPQLMINAAPGAWETCSESGWMTAELFLEWFKKFIIFSGATLDRKVLLLLDGHNSHTKNLYVIREARAHGVIILCFPPHTTHRLLVADVVYMRPLSTYYDQQITTWLRNNSGLVVTVQQVAEIFGKAFIQASTMSTAADLIPSPQATIEPANNPDLAVASTSTAPSMIPKKRTSDKSTFSVVSPEQLLPVPVTRKTSRASRKRGKKQR